MSTLPLEARKRMLRARTYILTNYPKATDIAFLDAFKDTDLRWDYVQFCVGAEYGVATIDATAPDTIEIELPYQSILWGYNQTKEA